MTTGLPSDEELVLAANEILQDADLDQLTHKRVRKKLEERFQADLGSRKEFLKKTVTEIITASGDEGARDEEEDGDGDEEGDNESNEDGDGDGDQDEEALGQKRKERGGGKKGGRKSNQMQLSPELFEFFGSKDYLMGRGDVMRALWAYIKENGRQDPNKKSEIINDDKLLKVFKCKRMTMFSMNRLLSKHLKKYSELVGDEEDEEDEDEEDEEGHDEEEEEEEEEDTPTKPQKKKNKKEKEKEKEKKSPSKSARSKKGEQPPKPRKPRPKKPSPLWRLSKELAAVLGSDQMPFMEINKRLHEYIKENNLKNPKDKRQILCDGKLEKVMGKKVVGMFEMAKYLGPHRLGKVD